jgi:hypothetical protein
LRDIYVRYALFLFLFRIGLFVVFDIQYDFAVRFRLLIGTFAIIYKRYTNVVLLPLKKLAGVYNFAFLHKIGCKCRIVNGYIFFLPTKQQGEPNLVIRDGKDMRYA